MGALHFFFFRDFRLPVRMTWSSASLRRRLMSTASIGIRRSTSDLFLQKDLSDKLSVYVSFVSFQARRVFLALAVTQKSRDSSGGGTQPCDVCTPTILSSLFLGRRVLDTVFIRWKKDICQTSNFFSSAMRRCRSSVTLLEVMVIGSQPSRLQTESPRTQPVSLPGRVLSWWFASDAISVAVGEQPVVSPKVRVPRGVDS